MRESRYRELAQHWMPHTRKSSKREGWQHPQDVVLLLKQMPQIPHPEVTILVAWLHDVLEDGVVATNEYEPDFVCDGVRVQLTDLVKSGVEIEIRNCVEWLTCNDHSPEGKAAYLKELARAPLPARVVKAADRIVNLQEGYYAFGAEWFIKYARLTREGVLPFVVTWPPPCGPWLTEQLAMQFRRAELLEEYERQ